MVGFAGSEATFDSPIKPHRDHDGYIDTVQWVPTRLIAATGHRTWGDFGSHRDHTPQELAGALRNSDNLDTFTRNLFWEPIALVRTPAWAGPIYRVSEGNHRTHTARMLNLPWLATSVSYQATPPPWKMTDLIANHPTKTELSQPHEQRLSNRAAHAAGLIRRGVIDGTLSHDGPQTILHCRHLPASWLLREAQEATAMNAAYESRYPGALASLGIPATIGTDAVAWTHWLTST